MVPAMPQNMSCNSVRVAVADVRERLRQEMSNDMTLRDEYAKAALAGIMANRRVNIRFKDVEGGIRPGEPYHQLAQLCFVMADAMLEARKQGERDG